MALALKFKIIVAVDDKFGIAKDGVTPWKIPGELAAFSKITKNTSDNVHSLFKNNSSWNVPITNKKNVLIMGSNTFKQFPISSVIAGNRIFIVLTSNPTSVPNAHHTQSSLNDALALCNKMRDVVANIFICGGAELYNQALYHPCCEMVIAHGVTGDFKCDKKFDLFPTIHAHNRVFSSSPPWKISMEYITIEDEDKKGAIIHRDINYAVHTRTYNETNYLELMTHIATTGIVKPNRTDTHTISLFAQSARYPLMERDDSAILPMFTTKKVSFALVYSELIWFISGGTNTDFLLKHNNHIWDDNGTREFLDKNKLAGYRPGELGPVYGFSWRHYGAAYITDGDMAVLQMTEDQRKDMYKMTGIDQLSNVINSIKTNPYSRRHVITAWNPSQLDEMALPPCHHTFTFNVEPDPVSGKPKFLSCFVDMRSNDMFLGHPFNVTSYALLTHMIARICGLTARELVISSVDAHIYINHVDQVKAQVSRIPYGYPTLKFSDRIMTKQNLTIDDFGIDDISVVNYYSHPFIKAKMAV